MTMSTITMTTMTTRDCFISLIKVVLKYSNVKTQRETLDFFLHALILSIVESLVKYLLKCTITRPNLCAHYH